MVRAEKKARHSVWPITKLQTSKNSEQCAMLVYIILSHLFLDLNQASKYNYIYQPQGLAQHVSHTAILCKGQKSLRKKFLT